MIKNISLHPKLVAVVDVFVGAIMLWWLQQITLWWLVLVWFAFREFLWAGFIQLIYCPAKNIRWRHFLSLTFFNFGILLLLLFLDWSPAWNLIAMVHILFTFISFWTLPSGKISGAGSSLKQHLRWRFILCTVGLAGIYSGVISIILFRIFYNINNWVWLIATVLLSTFIAGWHWNEYGIKYNKVFINWIIVFLILSLEFLWVVIQLPLGYVAGAILLIWNWYILWLIGRFSMSQEGIRWKKQTLFLTVNAFLGFVYLLFIVRWK